MPPNSAALEVLRCHVQCIWSSMSTFFLDDDCSSWAARGPSSGIGPLLAAGAQLQNSVTLLLDHGGGTVDLKLVDTQDQQRESACYLLSHSVCAQVEPAEVLQRSNQGCQGLRIQQDQCVFSQYGW